jgi:large subunit ribosomal protein L24
MAMRKIKNGDDVMILAGKDKGKRGTVSQIVSESRVVVTNMNTVTRHTKANARGEPGGLVTKEMPLHVSNVALFNPQTGKPDRVGFKVLADGRKVRVFKSTKEVIER